MEHLFAFGLAEVVVEFLFMITIEDNRLWQPGADEISF